MKEFNLEKAKNGAAVCMRDGTPVKILDFEFSNQEELEIVYKYKNDYGIDSLGFTDTSGKCVMIALKEEKERHDLFMAPTIGYMRVYKTDDGSSIYGGNIVPTIKDCKNLIISKFENPIGIAKVELLDINQ